VKPEKPDAAARVRFTLDTGPFARKGELEIAVGD
jgi:hypothetical protein